MDTSARPESTAVELLFTRWIALMASTLTLTDSLFAQHAQSVVSAMQWIPRHQLLASQVARATLASNASHSAPQALTD